ncbi:MAG: ATP-binding protein [Anaerolineales bacterium]
MMQAFRSRLGFKLLVSYLAVIFVAVAVLVSATQISLPGAFNRHLGGMAEKGQFGQGMPGAMGPGGRGQAMMSDLYRGFRDSFNEALALSILAASLSAVGVSLFFSRRVVAPLQAMMAASQRIAEGHYDERVHVPGNDELSQLAGHFNQMTERLEQTESMRRQLIGDVSHELRTPLTVIKGMMEGLVDGVLPGTPETYEQIHKEADRLSRLVEDLQELSRVEAGAFQLRLASMQIRDLILSIDKRMRPQFDARGITFQCEISPNLPAVTADEDRLLQVLINLLGNALQYTPSGGRVDLTAWQQGEQVAIRVADTGVGIAPEHLPHILTRFYRADPSRSRQSGGGSGIGLTVAKHLVEAQGGKITAESAGPGKGSQFTVFLPIASPGK